MIKDVSKDLIGPESKKCGTKQTNLLKYNDNDIIIKIEPYHLRELSNTVWSNKSPWEGTKHAGIPFISVADECPLSLRLKLYVMSASFALV